MLGAAYVPGIPDTDERIQGLTPSLDLRIRNKAKEVLVEEELMKRRYVHLYFTAQGRTLTRCRKVQVQFANEGAEKKKQEEEVSARKRKIEDKEKWEGESELPSYHPLPDCIRESYLTCPLRAGHFLSTTIWRFRVAPLFHYLFENSLMPRLVFPP